MDEIIIFWQNIKTVADDLKLPWVVMGDFNDFTCQIEKQW